MMFPLETEHKEEKISINMIEGNKNDNINSNRFVGMDATLLKKLQ